MIRWPEHIGQIVCGKNEAILPGIPDGAVDAVVVDPPYGLSFMGKKWDYDVPSVEQWMECFRVLKPGGHLLSFFGTRTYHRGVVNIEDAGFEIRDQMAWVYGSGFPKSLDVSKAIDKAAGAEREISGKRMGEIGIQGGNFSNATKRGVILQRDIPATEAAHQWNGWGSALKPAWEPICLARKPLIGTIAANVLEYGTGGINIDATRIRTDELVNKVYNNKGDALSWGGTYGKGVVRGNSQGRFPANLIHDGSDEVVALFPERMGGNCRPRIRKAGQGKGMFGLGEDTSSEQYGDSGSAARFFYCAKASRSERGEGNNHPTVKPLALMRYLVRLVTPPNGIVLDAWCGSGTTCKAAKAEGFRFIGIDEDEESCEIARTRLLSTEAEQKELAI